MGGSGLGGFRVWLRLPSKSCSPSIGLRCFASCYVAVHIECGQKISRPPLYIAQKLIPSIKLCFHVLQTAGDNIVRHFNLQLSSAPMITSETPKLWLPPQRFASSASKQSLSYVAFFLMWCVTRGEGPSGRDDVSAHCLFERAPTPGKHVCTELLLSTEW